MQRLHSEIDPAFFSNSFRPMNHLVKVLAAEARQRERRKGKGYSDEVVEEGGPSDDEEEAVKILTIEGRVVKIAGLVPSSTVDALRSAVEEKTGVTAAEMRLYIDAGATNLNLSDLSSRLEPLNDGSATLGDLGVFTEHVALHLRNREYESLRHQLAVATEVLEDVLEAHYDAFQENFERTRYMAMDFDVVRSEVAKLKEKVTKTRVALGLPESRVFDDQKTTLKKRRDKRGGKNNEKQRKDDEDDKSETTNSSSDTSDDDDDEENNQQSDDESDDDDKTRGDASSKQDDNDQDDDREDDDENRARPHMPFARRRKTRLIDVFEKKAEQDEINRIIAELRRRSQQESRE